ncbi:MAG: insulinase family protein [Clostridia bacterium]|nr:insulinase family protein [Clostridia bacterium]
MKNYSNLHGFVLKKATECPEQAATLVEYAHEKTGTPLFFLDRQDENMTFAIGFRTVPTDDTGVFHILEHSVLCGSEKYPVKDPFSELLKGSVNTFLNAFTYGERTVYPVSSLNKKAFLDLVDVYLDAVLHPLALENENIFLQEGHRLEFGEDGELSRNGIVFNEMRGAYSSPDELSAYYEGRLLFEGGCYGFDSGGNPSSIPKLTYGDFKAAHKKYYHPSNAIIFLDGSVELDPVLGKINSYLEGYEKSECFTEIPEGRPTAAQRLEVEYPVGSKEEEVDATRIILLTRFGSHSDKAGFYSISLAADSLADVNSAPLKKAMLDSGLCKNFSFYPISGMKYPVFVTRFTDVKDGCEEELISLYRRTLAKLLSESLDPEKLFANLNAAEFQTREADYGSYPRGMVYMSSVMEDAVCGDYPTLGLKYNELFTFLRSKLNTPHYIEALRAVFKGEERMLLLRPSSNAEKENAKREMAELQSLKRSLSEGEKQIIVDKYEAFEVWQATPDTAEAIATIPTLEISDLSDPPKETPTKATERLGARVILHPLPTSGISYVDLFFDVTDLDREDVVAASLMTMSQTDFDTHSHGAEAMRIAVKSTLGCFSPRLSAFKKDGKPRLYLQLSLSLLDSNKRQALGLLPELIYGRKYDDPTVLKRKILQNVTYAKEALPSSAPGSCIGLGAAAFDEYEAVKEIKGGISFFLELKRLEKENEEGRLLQKFTEITEKYLTRSRLTVSITGESDLDFADAVIGLVREGGGPAKPSPIKKFPRESVGIAIPAPVSFATLVTNYITEAHTEYHGSFMTLGTILDYELLWNEIRVKGGAYGTGFICRGNSGTTGYYSYRDPNPTASLDTFKSVPDMIRDFVAESPDLTRYIIGTVGSLEAVSTPRSEGELANTHYLSGKSREDILARRNEALHTSREDLLHLTNMLEEATESAIPVIAAPRELLEGLNLSKIIEL